jgi:uncharacterized protein (DUF488 family)
LSPNTILTVGYSTDSFETLVARLQRNAVQVVADVRSQPFSARNADFSRPQLERSLVDAGLRYVFLGELLGARSTDVSCYVEGRVRYDRLASRAPFAAGLDRLLRGATEHRVALLCAERDPLRCHRSILIARELVLRAVQVVHIVGETLESHEEALDRLLREEGLRQADIFRTREELVAEAYAKRESQIAYQEVKPGRLSKSR